MHAAGSVRNNRLWFRTVGVLKTEAEHTLDPRPYQWSAQGGESGSRRSYAAQSYTYRSDSLAEIGDERGRGQTAYASRNDRHDAHLFAAGRGVSRTHRSSAAPNGRKHRRREPQDRKSRRLNSSLVARTYDGLCS